MSQTYRDRRKTASVKTNETTRSIVEAGISADKPDLAAPVSTARMAEIEAIVDEAVAQCVDAAKRLGFSHAAIGVRHDWTWRASVAKAPRSRGGHYSRRYMELDAAYHQGVPVLGDVSELQPGISLKLAKHEKPSSTWSEYSAFDAHPLIGGRDELDHADVLRFLTAHECAHAIDHALPINTRHAIGLEWTKAGHYVRAARRAHAVTVDGQEVMIGGHEASWQGVYGFLRSELGLNSLGVPHGEKKKTEAYLCANCGVEFEAAKKARFCSTRCRTADHRHRAAIAKHFFDTLTDDEAAAFRAEFPNKSDTEIWTALDREHDEYIRELMDDDQEAVA